MILHSRLFSMCSSPIIIGMLLASQPVFAMNYNLINEDFDTRSHSTARVDQSYIPANQAFWKDTTAKNYYRVGPNIEELAPHENNQIEVSNPSSIQKIKSELFAKARDRDREAMLALGKHSFDEENFSEALEWYCLALSDAFCREKKINKDVFQQIQGLLKPISNRLVAIEEKLKGGSNTGKSNTSKKITGNARSQLQIEKTSLKSLSKRIDQIQKNIVGKWKEDRTSVLTSINFLDRLNLDERKWETGAETFYNLMFVMNSFDRNPVTITDTAGYLLKAGKQYKNYPTGFLEKAKRLEHYMVTLHAAQIFPSEPHSHAMFGFGVFHRDGMFDDAESERHIRAAQLFAKSGNQKALHSLGALYSTRTLTVDHENPQHILDEKQLFIRAVQSFEKAGLPESYETIGDLFAQASTPVDHNHEALPEISYEESLIKMAEYYWKSGSPAAMEHIYSMLLSNQLDESGAIRAKIDFLTLNHKYKDWLQGVSQRKVQILSPVTEAMLYLKGVLQTHEGSLNKAAALIKKHYNPAQAFQHIGAACLWGDLVDDFETRLKIAAFMFEQSGSSASLRMLSIIYLNLKDYEHSERYALQAQAMGENVKDVFEYLEIFKVTPLDEAASSDEEEDEAQSLVKETTPLPEESITVKETPLIREKKVHTVPDHSLKKERKQVKKLQKSQRDKKLIALLNKEKGNLKRQQEDHRAPWTVVDSTGNTYSDNQNVLKDILRQPWGLQGIGQPEILKNTPKGLTTYSRRITGEHRLLYVLKPQTQQVVVLKDRGHYGGSSIKGDYDLNQVLSKYLDSPFYQEK